jgi:hypothetical protein
MRQAKLRKPSPFEGRASLSPLISLSKDFCFHAKAEVEPEPGYP